MIFLRLYIGLLIMMLVLPVPAISHIGSVLLPEGCGSCHVGHGLSNEPMLAASQEEACYQCHGSGEKQAAMKSSGRLAEAARLADMEKEFSKPYRHPVEESSGHNPDEQLPGFAKSMSSHAECTDCHSPHQRVRRGTRQIGKVSGYSLAGQYKEKATYEYEICLKCHADETYGFASSPNIRRQFATSVRSMHPVTRSARGSQQISLKAAPGATGAMRCSDCHRSGDPDGPRGPHGSNHQYLLSGNYNTDGRADENPLAYEFCYSCHDRESLLSDESFPLHSEHIIGQPLMGVPGTSCFTCHASHSSEKYPYLLQFNPEVVKGLQPGDRIEYRSLGLNSGECYLSCHGRDHNPGRY